MDRPAGQSKLKAPQKITGKNLTKGTITMQAPYRAPNGNEDADVRSSSPQKKLSTALISDLANAEELLAVIYLPNFLQIDPNFP